jgi:hypothetical protein
MSSIDERQASEAMRARDEKKAAHREFLRAKQREASFNPCSEVVLANYEAPPVEIVRPAVSNPMFGTW